MRHISRGQEEADQIQRVQSLSFVFGRCQQSSAGPLAYAAVAAFHSSAKDFSRTAVVAAAADRPGLCSSSHPRAPWSPRGSRVEAGLFSAVGPSLNYTSGQ